MNMNDVYEYLVESLDDFNYLFMTDAFVVRCETREEKDRALLCLRDELGYSLFGATEEDIGVGKNFSFFPYLVHSNEKVSGSCNSTLPYISAARLFELVEDSRIAQDEAGDEDFEERLAELLGTGSLGRKESNL